MMLPCADFERAAALADSMQELQTELTSAAQPGQSPPVDPTQGGTAPPTGRGGGKRQRQPQHSKGTRPCRHGHLARTAWCRTRQIPLLFRRSTAAGGIKSQWRGVGTCIAVSGLTVRPGTERRGLFAAGVGAANRETDHRRGTGLSKPINSEAARREYSNTPMEFSNICRHLA